MKKIYHVLAVAALSVAAAALASCSKTEAPIDNTTRQPEGSQPIQFRATLAPKAEDPGTKAITVGTDGNGKEILNVAWKKDEKIAIYYQKTDNSYATATANVESVDSGTGVATITASLPDAKGGEAKFVYPASLANASGGIDESLLLNNQKGTLADISENFDAATATGTISVSGGTATVSGSIAMTNQVCICKFSFTYKYTIGTTVELNKLNSLIIKTASGDYRISPVSPATTGDVYVAILPCSNMNFAFIANATFTEGYLGSTSDFMAFPTNVSLTAGKFYRNLPVTLTLTTLKTGAALRDLSENAITASDGDIIWQRNNEATANTITIADGATVTLAGVNISAAGSAGIICSGNATINFKGSNIVSSNADVYPAIQAGGSGTTLTIQGDGTVTAKSYGQGAGIGSKWKQTCGDIEIKSGTIIANGGYSGGAGIGSGSGSGSGSEQRTTCGNITISGGSVTATGGDEAAGIGSGVAAICGKITVTKDVNSVTAYKINRSPYSIGKSSNGGTCGTITIGGTQYYDGTNFLNGGDTYLAQSPLVYEPPKNSE